MKKTGKILILTTSHLCRNPRVVKEATTLGAAGHDVTVMTVSMQPRFEVIDRELIAGLPFRRQMLDYSSNTPGARVRGFLQRGATWTARRLCREWGFETAQALGPASALLHRVRAVPADLTILHTEIPIWAAQHLVHDGRRVAVDVEDWYSEDLLFADRQSRPIRLLRAAEKFALQHCAYASATSQSMADGLVNAYGCPPPHVIRNTFPLQPYARSHEPGPNDTPRFIWFSQTIGPGRGLELFLAAWAQTRQPSKVCLLGDVYPGYPEKLLRRLPAARRGDLQFLPLLKPEELPARLVDFDIGLALEPNWPPNKNLTISNKIFQYLNAGLAVVASDTAGQQEVMKIAPDCGLLVSAHETTDFARQLDMLLGDRNHLRTAQLASRAAAEREFCWERDTPQLLAAVERALS
jgi:glycosyltransferase involved in cell wall biosynthesis